MGILSGGDLRLTATVVCVADLALLSVQVTARHEVTGISVDTQGVRSISLARWNRLLEEPLSDADLKTRRLTP